MNNKQNKDLSKFIKISLLGAMAVVLMYFDFPIPFLPFPWLKIDLSDIPALMGAFAFGPMVGVIIELLKNILILIVKGTGTAFIGEIANFIVGVSLVAPVAWVYHRNKSKKSVLFGMLLGIICVEIVGIIANIYLLLPIYGGIQMSSSELVNYIIIGLIPFNGLKALMVYVITYVLYKRVSVAFLK